MSSATNTQDTEKRYMSISIARDSVYSKVEPFKPLPEYSTSKKFLTGSKYEGSWNTLGMSGYGTYTYPHGVIYKGTFKDGEFDGWGSLTYPQGAVITGVWKEGELIQSAFQFSDGLLFDMPWNYCNPPDRRFFVSQRYGLEPAGRENRTNVVPPRRIPVKCFDSGEGIFNPLMKSTISAYTSNKIIRIPTASDEDWIVNFCREGGDRPVGYRPELYESWTTGASKDPNR